MDGFDYQKIPPGFLTTEQTKKFIGVTDNCLRNWANEGKIPFTRIGDKGHRRYNVRAYFEQQNKSDECESKPIPREPTKHRVIYARVSGRSQSTELENQADFLRTKFPSHELIRDFGSGLNYNRKGLRTILEYAYAGTLEELVVTYKDRLCRWGFELLEEIFRKISGTRIIVLSQPQTSTEQELCEDIISVITVFTARLHGKRGYGKHGKKRREAVQDPKIQDLTSPKCQGEDENNSKTGE
jgi:predicted site-specific integrase-resolvase